MEKKSLTIGTVPKTNKKIVTRDKIDTFNNKNTGPHIFLDWYSTSLQRLKLVVWAQPSSFHKLVQ
jgi:hypothetical protein